MKWSLGASTLLSLHNSVRLACVKHAASVHPEPGSNSHVYSPGSKTFWLSIRGMISHSSWCFVLLFWNSSLEFSGLHCCLFVKVLFCPSRTQLWYNITAFFTGQDLFSIFYNFLKLLLLFVIKLHPPLWRVEFYYSTAFKCLSIFFS